MYQRAFRFSESDQKWVTTAPKTEIYRVAEQALRRLYPREILAIAFLNKQKDKGQEVGGICTCGKC